MGDYDGDGKCDVGCVEGGELECDECPYDSALEGPEKIGDLCASQSVSYAAARCPLLRLPCRRTKARCKTKIQGGHKSPLSKVGGKPPLTR